MKRISFRLVMTGKFPLKLLLSNQFQDIFSIIRRSLCLWSAMKKKPLHTKELAHGKSAENAQANWISAVATLINTDIIATGEL